MEDTKVYDNEINEKGFWETETDRGHCYDSGLAEELGKHLNSYSVYDFGCGPGDYTKYFVDAKSISSFASKG